MTNREQWKGAYPECLRECLRKHPDHYPWPEANVPVVAERMFAAMDRGTFNHDSHAMRMTARRLGIKPTRTAIVAFWKS